MALSASTVLEVRTTGADTNGGGFVTGASGTDWSQQAATQYSVTDGVAAGTTTLTSATANFGTDVVGNLIYVQGGTGSITAGWYQIATRVNSTTITVDRSTGLTAGTGVTLNIGGALATPGQASGIAAVDGQYIHVKSGTYNISNSTANTSGGPVSLTAGVCMEGYNSSRGDLGTQPTINANATGSITICKINGSFGHTGLNGFINMAVDGNSQASVIGFSQSSSFANILHYCKASNCTTGMTFAGSGGNKAVACLTSGCTTGYTFSGPASLSFCTASGGTTGYSVSAQPVTFSHCLAYGMSGRGFDVTYAVNHINCVADNCGSDGFRTSSLEITSYVNCVATNCGTSGTVYGFNLASTAAILVACGGYNNRTALFSATPKRHLNPLTTISVDPWTNQAGADYKPNSSGTGGAVLRAASINVAGQTAYLDAGCDQHQDSGGTTVAFANNSVQHLDMGSRSVGL